MTRDLPIFHKHDIGKQNIMYMKMGNIMMPYVGFSIFFKCASASLFTGGTFY